MQWLFRWSDPDLSTWEQRPFSADSESGPRPNDNRDNHERMVACEEPGPPRAIARRLADAILRYDVFPSSMVIGVLRRTPVEIGDTVGVRFHFVPGLDLFFAARVTDRSFCGPGRAARMRPWASRMKVVGSPTSR